ncbi:MAG: hypothetical protein V4617_02640 [Gemmatimonadota bacterium]
MRARTLLGMLAALATLGCSNDPVSPADPLVFTAALSRSAIRPGDTLTVIVTVTNTSTRTALVNPKACPSLFEVLYQGSSVAPGPQICTMEGYPPIRIAPGASHVFRFPWDTRTNVASTRVTLPPGDYTVRARFAGGAETSPGSFYRYSAPVPFRIIPPAIDELQ